MAKLEGTLTKKQRVEIAKDVIALCKSRQRKITIGTGSYLCVEDFKTGRSLLQQGGQLTSKRLPKCEVCARGAMFVASVDRHDRCDLTMISFLNSTAADRSASDWGYRQARLIEAAFELSADVWTDEFVESCPGLLNKYINTLPNSPKARLIVLMENVIKNKGVFVVPGMEEG